MHVCLHTVFVCVCHYSLWPVSVSFDTTVNRLILWLLYRIVSPTTLIPLYTPKSLPCSALYLKATMKPRLANVYTHIHTHAHTPTWVWSIHSSQIKHRVAAGWVVLHNNVIKSKTACWIDFDFLLLFRVFGIAHYNHLNKTKNHFSYCGSAETKLQNPLTLK